MQKELTARGPLLNEKGELHEAGYARQLVKQYDRRAIKAAAHRIKEWDYYLMMNDRWGVALTIDDNSYMGLLGFSLLDFSRPWEHTCNLIYPFTNGKTAMPASSEPAISAVPGNALRANRCSSVVRRTAGVGPGSDMRKGMAFFPVQFNAHRGWTAAARRSWSTGCPSGC